MGAAYMLQNRKLPQQQGGARVVYAWPMDVIEAFCSSGDIAFTDTAPGGGVGGGGMFFGAF